MVKNFVRIDGWPVAPALARDWIRMAAAARAEGVILRLNSGYRTRSEQIEIFTQRYRQGATSPWSDYRKFRGFWWGRVDPLGPVASPDDVSNHTRGYAVDIFMGPGVFDWLTRNAARFGFNHKEGANIGEPWHWCWRIEVFPAASSPDPWEGRGAPDPVYPTDPGLPLDSIGHGGVSLPTEINPLLELDMPLLYQPTDGPWKGKHYAIGQGYIKHIPTKESVKLYADAHHTLGMKEIFVSDKTFRTILGVNGIDSKVLDSNGHVFDYRASEKYKSGGSYMRGDDESAKRTYRLASKK